MALHHFPVTTKMSGLAAVCDVDTYPEILHSSLLGPCLESCIKFMKCSKKTCQEVTGRLDLDFNARKQHCAQRLPITKAVRNIFPHQKGAHWKAQAHFLIPSSQRMEKGSPQQASQLKRLTQRPPVPTPLFLPPCYGRIPKFIILKCPKTRLKQTRIRSPNPTLLQNPSTDRFWRSCKPMPWVPAIPGPTPPRPAFPETFR